MQVKIIKCHSDSFWYKNNIGEIFNVIRMKNERNFEYYLCKDFFNERIISIQDAIPFYRNEKIKNILNKIKCTTIEKNTKN